MDNPNGAYGIAVSTPEGMTTDNKFYNNSGITVNGDVNITVSGNKKAADVLENSAGLFVDSNHAKITLNHKGNIISDGNGIVVAPVHNTPNYNNQAITVKKEVLLSLFRQLMVVSVMQFIIPMARFFMAQIQSAA